MSMSDGRIKNMVTLRKTLWSMCWVVVLVCLYQLYEGHYFTASLGIGGAGMLLLDLLCTSPVDEKVDNNSKQL